MLTANDNHCVLRGHSTGQYRAVLKTDYYLAHHKHFVCKHTLSVNPVFVLCRWFWCAVGRFCITKPQTNIPTHTLTLWVSYMSNVMCLRETNNEVSKRARAWIIVWLIYIWLCRTSRVRTRAFENLLWMLCDVYMCVSLSFEILCLQTVHLERVLYMYIYICSATAIPHRSNGRQIPGIARHRQTINTTYTLACRRCGWIVQKHERAQNLHTPNTIITWTVCAVPE